ncbi:hypothetical protein ACTJI2_16575 [Pseudoxanthomonas sp. 22568]|uniref:hypothetical protein n=1 Tax=Pseudoxanthomonas sp. 22568 TaxID=3453945 RepID=UPI003F82713E
MNYGLRVVAGFLLAAMTAACTPNNASEESEATPPAEEMAAAPVAVQPAPPSLPAPAPGTSSGSMVVYACDDSSGLTVTYDKHNALVKLPSGSTMLTRAESASNGFDEAYIGEELSLYRSGDAVQLQSSGTFRNCSRLATGG